MEAIRLSLASAEEEQKKQDKDGAKRAKKEEKQKAKDAKKAAKEARRSGSGGMYSASMNSSEANGFNAVESSTAAATAGKGKAPASSGSDQAPASRHDSSSKTPKDDPQAFLERSRASIQSGTIPIPNPSPPQPQPHLLSTTPPRRQAMRHLSNTSSISSLNDSQDTSPSTSGLHIDQTTSSSATAGPYSETPPGGGAGTEPMFNFRSLAAVIGDEEDEKGGAAVEHLDNAAAPPSPLAGATNETGESSSPNRRAAVGTVTPPERPLSAGERLFGVRGTSPPPSLSTSPPRGGGGAGLGTLRELSASPKTVVTTSRRHGDGDGDDDDEDGGVVTPHASNPYDAKHYGDISILDSGPFSSAR
jgi:hypothetical protein